MPRLSNVRAIKAPLRNLFSHPLCGPIQTRHIHNGLAPFSGPPSYATIAQRFSRENPSPISYFTHKRAEDAVKRGDFVDVHDISSPGPKDYDVLLTDVTYEILHNEISDLIGIKYLKEATKEEAGKTVGELHGIIYGKVKYRKILPCVLTMKGQARWVFFLVDEGSPSTYISDQVRQSFGILMGTDPWKAKIAGIEHTISMSPEDSHFPDVNLLGGDFATLNNVTVVNDGESRTFRYCIGQQWETTFRQKL